VDNYDAIGIVERLAQALDEEDYATASACLEPDAEYDDGARVIKGAEAILQSFAESAERGRKTFERVIFRHEISINVPLDIRFIDILSRNGEEFALDHTMRVALSERGLVKSLQLIFPPGERERLADFLRNTADD
jgi:hypothetical protein